MNQRIDKITKRENDQGTIDDMMKKGLDSNCWIIDSEIKYVKQINGYNSIIVDLNHSKECILELKRRKEVGKNELDDRLIIKSLFTNSIISYSRCFGFNKKEGRISIDFKIVNKYLSKDSNIIFSQLYSFHEYIIEMRNKFVAHADKNDYESERLYVKYNYDSESEYLNYSFLSYELKMNSFDEIQIKNFLIIIETLLIIANDKLDILLPKLKNEIGEDKLVNIGLKTLKLTKDITANNL